MQFDEKIAEIMPIYAEIRKGGDILHSQASIEKARDLLGYRPQFSLENGLKEAIRWYWENLK